jgi:DNA polymerase
MTTRTSDQRGAIAAKKSAADFVPQKHSLRALREAARHCQGCELFRAATQTVFGEGSASAKLVVVGETPGDQEDRQGHPFVGPAGRLLDEAFAEAGLRRDEVYVTNAVKHFKWEPRGKKRLHAKPSSREISACRPWLEAEIEAVSPRIIVCLGATAAQTLLGRTFRLTKHFGEPQPSAWAEQVLATYHPSAILRAPTPSDREKMRRQLFGDLRWAARYLAKEHRP